MDATERSELQRWMCRLADGDRSAFHPVFERAYPLLRRFAQSMLQGAPEAEDAAQQALLKVFSRAAQFDPKRDALSWMFAVTAFECRTLRAGRARRRESQEVSDATCLTTPESELAHRGLLAAARDVLGSLRAEDVSTLTLAWDDGPRPGVAAATFRKRVQRAVERLRLAWRLKHGAD